MRQLHVSALLGKVYWADAKGNVMREPKQDVTNNFLGCVLQYFTDTKHGVIHDAEGNEWEVTIVQTKAAPSAPAPGFKAKGGVPVCECGCVKSGHHVDGLGRGYCDGCGLCDGFKAKEG